MVGAFEEVVINVDVYLAIDWEIIYVVLTLEKLLNGQHLNNITVVYLTVKELDVCY